MTLSTLTRALSRRLADRARYRRTVAELSRLPATLALEDLGFWPGDARLIARRAVYGR